MNPTHNAHKKIIFLIGLIFRIALVVYIILTNSHHLDFFNNPDWQGGDQSDFFRLVKNIADNGKFSFDGITPDQFRTPIFPFFAAFSYLLTHGFLLYTFLNILVSCAIGVVAYEIACLLFAEKRLAFWSGLIFNLLPYGAYLSTMVMADNLFTLFFALYILFFIKVLKNPPLSPFVKGGLKGDLILVGLFLALATLTRPITQYLIFFSVFLLLITPSPLFIRERVGVRDSWKIKIKSALIMLAVFILVSSPWLIRNYLVFQKPAFSSLGGYHMFVSWVAPYRAYIKDHISRSAEAEKAFQYIKDKYGKYGSEAMYDPVISAKLGDEAKQEILSNWTTYLPFHIFSGVIFYMNNDVFLTLSEVFHINFGNIYAFQHLFKLDFTGFLKNIWQLNWLYLIIYLGSYFLIFGKNILALFGLSKYWKTSPIITVFVLFILIYFPLLVGPEGHARFRYPVEPFLLIFALSVFLKQSDNKKNKIIYIVNARIPTEKAHGAQIMNMCRAFVSAGANLELVVPARFNDIKKSPFEYYGLKNNFEIKKLPVLDLVPWNIPLAFQIETLTFAFSTFFYLFLQSIFLPLPAHRERVGVRVLYTRGEMILFLAPFAKLFKMSIFWETHIKPDNIAPYQKLFLHIKGFITVTEYYKKELIEKYGVPAEKIICAPDGVNLEKFDIQMNKNEARAKLSLPLDKKIIMYAGSLIPWKGAEVLKEVSSLLPDNILLVILAGGEREDIQLFNSAIGNLAIKNIILLEHRPPAEIPYYLKSADLLILTGTKKSEISLYYTSPLKLFEYMASDRPILSADILSFREILNDDNAFFYDADNADDLAKKIEFILYNYSLAEQKSAQAFRDVKNYTWTKRAEKISTLINYLCYTTNQ